MLPSFFQACAKVASALLLPIAFACAAPVAAASLTDAQPMPTAAAPDMSAGDAQFAAIFSSWKRLDTLQGVVAVPSGRPVDLSTFTSGYGVRSDPFRHSAAMHAGVDLAGPTGSPVYATADGVVAHAGWLGGYGNLVKIEHGKALETRYGHLSKILVRPGTPVKRGQLIALLGSTGRSTGPHLHYEVRVDGRAVNPLPFIQADRYLIAMQQRGNDVALGGPEE